MAGKIRVGVAGYGTIGQRLADGVALQGDMELVGVADLAPTLAIRALKEKGFRVPEDVSVIGFDDLPYSEICSPRLTSLKVPKQEMGAAAAKCLIEVLNGEHPAKTKTEICTEFIERDSVQKKEKTE